MIQFNINLLKISVELRNPITIRKSTKQKVIEALRDGKKLLAVKIYKEATDKGLKESKEYVDTLSEKHFNRDKQRLMFETGKIE